jgi:hypothetical protein
VTHREFRLMQHHDGELDALQAAEEERRLAWDPAGRVYLDRLETIGDAVRDAVQQTTPAAHLTHDIMTRIECERVGHQSAWYQRLASPFGWGLGSTAALAAAAFLWLAGPTRPEDRSRAASGPHATQTAGETLSGGLVGVAIESVDFGAGGGSIFMVQGGQDTTPVVWLSEPELTEVRSEPL